MAAFRRTRWLAFFHEDAVVLDLGALLEGELDVTHASNLVAASALTGEKTKVTQDEFELLGRLSDRWIAAEALGPEADVAFRLAERGLVIADVQEEPMKSLRERDERLEAEQWDRGAALFHFLSRRRTGTALTVEDAENVEPELTGVLEAVVEVHGPPPPAFHNRNAQQSYSLDVHDPGGAVYDALGARRTTRKFDDTAVSRRDLSILLRYTFGCHGYWRYTRDLVALRKTAPSGGALHPIEAYALVLNVDGIPTGAYHYNVARHSLDLLEPMQTAAARSRVAHAACGQHYFAAASVVVVLSARFFRNFWKYRTDARAYSVLLMDAGHLAQTFHLVGAEIGLGTFVTAAIDGPSADALIDVDGVGESAIAFLGCGHASRERSVLDRDPIPFIPGAPLSVG